jgi:hypothetical protein
MTITSGPAIKLTDVAAEGGQSYSSSLNFLHNLIKPAQRPSTPKLSNFYNKAYYQRNADGNCNNGNCTSNCNCGNIQCNNCLITGTVNCANCDGQNWYQTNCNCACTYNCNYGPTSYNCNCDCSCCVVATELNSTGDWSFDRLFALTEWANRVLDTSWVGERFHRGYHVIGSKVFVPNIRRGGLLGKYFAWTFNESTEMLQGKPHSFWSVPNNCFWIGSMFLLGLLVTKRYAKRTWIRMYKEIRDDQHK